MARSQNSYIKFQKEKKKKKKQEDKRQRKLEKKDTSTSGKLEDMLAYVDEFGNIVSEPPEEKPKKRTDLEKPKKPELPGE